MAATVKAKVIRPVYVRGVERKEGDVIEVSHQEYHEMRSAYQVVKYEEPEAPAPVVAPVAPVAPEVKADDKKGK